MSRLEQSFAEEDDYGDAKRENKATSGNGSYAHYRET
jgi:hypothetical protein